MFIFSEQHFFPNLLTEIKVGYLGNGDSLGPIIYVDLLLLLFKKMATVFIIGVSLIHNIFPYT